MSWHTSDQTSNIPKQSLLKITSEHCIPMRWYPSSHEIQQNRDLCEHPVSQTWAQLTNPNYQPQLSTIQTFHISSIINLRQAPIGC